MLVEEEASAVEEEVVASEAAEELLAVVQEEVALAVVEAEVDIDLFVLIKTQLKSLFQPEISFLVSKC